MKHSRFLAGLLLVLLCGGIASAGVPFTPPETGRSFTVMESYKGNVDYVNSFYGRIAAEANITMMSTFTVMGPTMYEDHPGCFRDGSFMTPAYEVAFSGTAQVELHLTEFGGGGGLPTLTDLSIRGVDLPYSGAFYFRQADMGFLAQVRKSLGVWQGWDEIGQQWLDFVEANATIVLQAKEGIADYNFPLVEGQTWTTSAPGCAYAKGVGDFRGQPGSPIDIVFRDNYAVYLPTMWNFQTAAVQELMYAPGKTTQTYVSQGTDANIIGGIMNYFSPALGFPVRMDYLLDRGVGIAAGTWRVVNTDFFTTGVDDVALSSFAGCTDGYSIDVYQPNGLTLGSPIGQFACAGGTPSYNVLTSGGQPGPLLLRFTGNIPQFRCGDYLTITPETGDPFRVYLPENLGGFYGSDFSLWVQTDGTTLFANDMAMGRTGMPNQGYASAVEDNDYAATGGERSTEFVVNPVASNFTFFYNEFCNAALDSASALRTALVTEAGDAEAVTTISRYNATSQTWQNYVYVSIPFLGIVFETGDFTLNQGDVLRIETNNASTSFTAALGGTKPFPGDLAYNLKTTPSTSFNFVGIPSYRADLDMVAEVAADIANTSTTEVSGFEIWNPISQSWTQYIPAIGTGNFDVTAGDSLRLDVTQAGVWTP